MSHLQRFVILAVLIVGCLACVPPSPPPPVVTPPPVVVDPPPPAVGVATWIVHESDDMTPEWAQVVLALQTREPAKQLTVHDVDTEFPQKSAFAEYLNRLPALIVTAADGAIVYGGPCPLSYDGVVDILRQYGALK